MSVTQITARPSVTAAASAVPFRSRGISQTERTQVPAFLISPSFQSTTAISKRQHRDMSGQLTLAPHECNACMYTSMHAHTYACTRAHMHAGVAGTRQGALGFFGECLVLWGIVFAWINDHNNKNRNKNDKNKKCSVGIVFAWINDHNNKNRNKMIRIKNVLWGLCLHG